MFNKKKLEGMRAAMKNRNSQDAHKADTLDKAKLGMYLLFQELSRKEAIEFIESLYEKDYGETAPFSEIIEKRDPNDVPYAAVMTRYLVMRFINDKHIEASINILNQTVSQEEFLQDSIRSLNEVIKGILEDEGEMTNTTIN